MRGGRKTMEDLSFMRLMVLVEIVETGGFGTAAKRLNLTQPAVSFHVRALDRIFGSTLFQDPRRGVELTDSGKLVYELARRTVNHAQSVMRDVQKIKSGERGRLVVGASLAIGDRTAPLAIAAYHKEFPDVDVVLYVLNSQQISEQMTNGSLDVGLVLDPDILPGLESTPLYVEELCFVTAPDHPLQGLSPAQPRDVGGCPIVVSPRDTMHYRLLREWFHLNGVSHYKVAAEIQSVGGMVTAVESHLGIAALYRSTIHHPLLTGTIRILDVAQTPVRVPAYLVQRPGRPTDPLLDGFREFLFQWVSSQKELSPVMSGDD
jgi:DNA-binding transcriptional LysR family regulator